MGKHEMPRPKENKKTFRRRALIVIMLMVIAFAAYTVWDVLQPPEAVGRLGKACLPGLGGAHRRGVRGGDGVQKFK